jgi:hypothetical protein
MYNLKKVVLECEDRDMEDVNRMRGDLIHMLTQYWAELELVGIKGVYNVVQREERKGGGLGNGFRDATAAGPCDSGDVSRRGVRYGDWSARGTSGKRGTLSEWH